MAGDINPESGKESARAHDECVVKEGMERISLNIKKVARRTDVVSKSTNGGSSAGAIVVRPLANETDKEVALVFSLWDFRKEVTVVHEVLRNYEEIVLRLDHFNGISHF